jgi:wobble nucleotide-excising tRNase
MYKQEISRFKTAENNLTKKIVQTKKTLESLQKEKDKKITEITGVKPSIEKINKLLIAFGFTNFKLSSAEKPGFYKIVRDSKEEAKSTLSEGELTFITFLYYYQLTQGDLQAENVNEDKILIIDDPISSLDSNVLHIVSSIIKYLMEQVKSNNSNLKQLILLTHNIYFHKEVTYKVDNSTFWILKKIQNKTKIKRFDKNPIKSSYELLWSEIKNNTESIALQNNMRRILEYYFTIIGNHDSLKHCVNLFDSPEEKNIARALILWTNDGSHSFDDELFIQGFDDTSESYNKVFKDLFYKTGHDGHYNMMMRLENKEIDKSLHNSVS